MFNNKKIINDYVKYDEQYELNSTNFFELLKRDDFSTNIETLHYLTKILTDYLCERGAIQTLLLKKEFTSEKSTKILSYYYDLAELVNVKLKTTYYDNENNNRPVFDINKINLVVNAWNPKRILENINGINEKNKLEPHINIINKFLFPLDIVVSTGGNHSQFSAKLRNEGETHITNSLDLSPLYKYYKFNGKDFIDSKTNNVVNLSDTYGFHNEIFIVCGVLFEIGRLKLKNKNYPFLIKMN